MGMQPILPSNVFTTIDAMLNFDGEFDGDSDGDVTCKQTSMYTNIYP